MSDNNSKEEKPKIVRNMLNKESFSKAIRMKAVMRRCPYEYDYDAERGECVLNYEREEQLKAVVRMCYQKEMTLVDGAEEVYKRTGKRLATASFSARVKALQDEDIRQEVAKSGEMPEEYAKLKRAEDLAIYYGKLKSMGLPMPWEKDRVVGGVKVKAGVMLPYERKGEKVRLRLLKEAAVRAKGKRERRAAIKKAVEKMEDVKVSKKGSVVVPDVTPMVRDDARWTGEHKRLVEKLEETKNVVFKPNPGPQTIFLSSSEDDILYGGSAGGGKVVKKGDRVSTPFGWKKIEDLCVGDLISNPLGGVQKIVQLHPWMVYSPTRVGFSDGTFVDVHEDHLWQAWRARHCVKREGKRVNGISSREVVETRTLRQWLEAGYHPQIPVTQPIAFNTTTREKNRIPPYLLGVLLGDGCITTSAITLVAHEDDQPHLKQMLPYGDDVVYKGQQIRFRGATRKWLEEKLSLHSLLGTRSNSKFIPHVYKYAPIEDRWELVRGLMDTDGYSAPDKNGCYFTSVSRKLAEDMAEVLRSLGCVVSVSTKEGKYRDTEGSVVMCQLAYELYIKSRNDSLLFNLPRKKTNRPPQEISKRVVSVEKLSTVVEGRCITVSGVEGLYCTNDYIVTHNSLALLIDPLRYCGNRHQRGLVMRKTMPELRELMDKARELYPQAYPGARYKEVEKRWIFPSGATIEFGYLERDSDVYRYQGQSFSYIAFDEITHLPTEFAWNYLASRLRTTDSSLPCYQRCTANPGGPGQHWVKKRYIDPAPPGIPFRGEDGLIRKFIPAFLKDNPYLASDGRYERMLRSLPEVQRRRLLEGDWNVSDGAAFPEFDRDVHIIKPFDIPPSWQRIKAIDYGYASPSCVLWGAIDPSDGTIVVYRELYQKGLTGEELGNAIVEMEMSEMRTILGVLDGAAWNKVAGGPTVGEILTRPPFSLKLRPADKNRMQGKVMIHQMLRRRTMVNGELGRPGVQIFSTCANLIREMYALPLSETNSEDVDTHHEDHAYDALRYMLMSRPNTKPSHPMQFSPTFTRRGVVDEIFGY